MPKAAPEVPGSIGANDLYTLHEVRRRLGLSAWSIWRARRNGLKVHRIARRRYVLGRDFIAYVEAAGR